MHDPRPIAPIEKFLLYSPLRKQWSRSDTSASSMNHFRRVRHSLRADTGMTAAIILCGAILVSAGWFGWACCARIVRVETSDTARLEIDSAPYPVQASTSGRLVSNYLNLGRRVQAGDVLFELDTRSEKLTLQEENVRLAALQPQLAALMQQMEEESQG